LSDQQPTISTHVLDVERGLPAAGVSVELFMLAEDGERLVGAGMTDEDGRIRRLLDGPLQAGEYVIEFTVDGPFFRELAVQFSVQDTTRSYHVPLIVAPYSLATYRGS
jgi:5-hydroxyisourate hydrolase